MRALPLLLSCFVALACSTTPPVPDPTTDASQPVDSSDAGHPSDAGRTPDSLDELLEPRRQKAELPALGAAVFDSEGVLGIGAVGVRKHGDETPVTTNDKWHLGSDTKAMTSALVAVLVEDGLLDWSTTLEQAFGADWVPDLHDSYRAVTIAQLLGHLGGTPGPISADLWNPLWQPGEVKEQRRAFTQALLARAPAQAPGTFVYSNAGYMVVGAYLEKLTGKSWEALIEERLFAPLGMKSCGFGPQATAGTTDQPWGHSRTNGSWIPQHLDNPKALGPAGTVHCSLEDWGRYLAEHLKGARGEPTVLPLPASAWTTLHAPGPGSSYALGWGVGQRTWAGGTVLTHTGSNTMNFAVVWLAPAIDRAFVAVTNAPEDVSAPVADETVASLIERFPPAR